MAGDWTIWQLIDSAFPAGGFAHSGGLEAAWQYGAVPDARALEAFVAVGLAQATQFSLPMVRAAASDAPGAWAGADAECDALTNNAVTNRASRLQGRALLSAAGHAFADQPGVVALREEAKAAKLAGHHAPAFGAVARELGLGAERAAEGFAFSLVRGWVSAAVRLGIVGPLEAQSIQFRASALAAGAVSQSRDVPLSDVAQTAPLLDLLQGTQDRLYSRLFQS